MPSSYFGRAAFPFVWGAVARIRSTVSVKCQILQPRNDVRRSQTKQNTLLTYVSTIGASICYGNFNAVNYVLYTHQNGWEFVRSATSITILSYRTMNKNPPIQISSESMKRHFEESIIAIISSCVSYFCDVKKALPSSASRTTK